jgi:hypothetical protein
MNIEYDNKLITTVSNTKFLGTVINNIVLENPYRANCTTLREACYAMISVKPHIP